MTAPPINYKPLADHVPDDKPWDIRPLADGRALELEIGYGRGSFLLERALAAPDSFVMGIEVKSKLAYAVESSRKAMGLSNAKAYWGDAVAALTRMSPDASLTRVFVHFPDPWWKRRHNKRRVVGDTLLVEVARLLAPGGELFVQTDVKDRAEDFRNLLSTSPELVLQGDSGFVQDNTYRAQSNREKRAVIDGLPIYRILALRR